MPRRRLAAAVVAAALAAPVPQGPARAQDNPLHVRNAGAVPCERIAAIAGAPGNEVDKTAVLHWLGGYATASAAARGVIDVFPLADSGEFVQMVVLICGEAPAALFRVAAETAILRLEPYWVRDRAETVRIDDGTGVTVMFRAAVTPLQTALAARGARLTVDGAYGPQTGAAIRALAEQAGLPPVQRPTGILLYLLTRP